MMSSPGDCIRVHSVAEAYLYVLTIHCSRCKQGRLQTTADLTHRGERWSLAIRCDACRCEEQLQFAIDPAPTRDDAQSNRINGTSEPSRAIDLHGWLALFQSILAASEKETDPKAVRQLAFEAAQCLDEALKFFTDDNDLPPERAFFTAESLQRFREHPGYFARTKWIERKHLLPQPIRTQ